MIVGGAVGAWIMAAAWPCWSAPSTVLNLKPPDEPLAAMAHPRRYSSGPQTPRYRGEGRRRPACRVNPLLIGFTPAPLASATEIRFDWPIPRSAAVQLAAFKSGITIRLGRYELTGSARRSPCTVAADRALRMVADLSVRCPFRDRGHPNRSCLFRHSVIFARVVRTRYLLLRTPASRRFFFSGPRPSPSCFARVCFVIQPA